MTSERRVLQSFYDRHVRIFQIGVLPHQCDGDAVEETLLATKGGGVQNPLNGVDAQAVWAWVDNYCKANPLNLIENAGAAFVATHPR